MTDDGYGHLMGMIRVDSGGANVFEIHLNGKMNMYGRWGVTATGERTFCVDVISFGYDNEFNVDNDHIDARSVISSSEDVAIRKIISELFKIADTEKSILPFGFDVLQFDGCIRYLSGWIRTV
jgi:hypothetical protein